MLKIEVTLKFDNDDQTLTSESDLQLAVKLLAAMGAKFPYRMERCTRPDDTSAARVPTPKPPKPTKQSPPSFLSGPDPATEAPGAAK